MTLGVTRHGVLNEIRDKYKSYDEFREAIKVSIKKSYDEFREAIKVSIKK
jgi:hypothetical protein